MSLVEDAQRVLPVVYHELVCVFFQSKPFEIWSSFFFEENQITFQQHKILIFLHSFETLAWRPLIEFGSLLTS